MDRIAEVCASFVPSANEAQTEKDVVRPPSCCSGTTTRCSRRSRSASQKAPIIGPRYGGVAVGGPLIRRTLGPLAAGPSSRRPRRQGNGRPTLLAPTTSNRTILLREGALRAFSSLLGYVAKLTSVLFSDGPKLGHEKGPGVKVPALCGWLSALPSC